MPVGKGKYGHLAEDVLKKTQGIAAFVMVVGGKDGPGFAIASLTHGIAVKLPTLLRLVADEIENDMKGPPPPPPGPPPREVREDRPPNRKTGGKS